MSCGGAVKGMKSKYDFIFAFDEDGKGGKLQRKTEKNKELYANCYSIKVGWILLIVSQEWFYSENYIFNGKFDKVFIVSSTGVTFTFKKRRNTLK